MQIPIRIDMPARWVGLAAWLIGIILAMYRATQITFWSDEFHSLRLGQLPLTQLLAGDYRDTQPPLYYILLQLYANLAGWSELALRGFSLLWMSVALALAFWVGRELWQSERAGALACALFALHPFFTNYAAEIRAYALIAALGLAALYSGLRLRRAADADVPVWAGGLLLTSGLSLYVHHFGALVPASIGAIALVDWFTPSLRRRSYQIIGVLALASLAYIPGALLLLKQLEIYRPQGSANPMPFRYVFQLFTLSYHRPAYESLIALSTWVTLGTVLIGTLWHVPTRAAAARVLAALGICLTMGIVVYTIGVGILPRYIIHTVMLACLALSGVVLLDRGIWRLIGRGLALLMLVIYLGYAADFARQAPFENQIADFKVDWRVIGPEIAAARQPDEPLVILSWEAATVQLYAEPPIITSFTLTDELATNPRSSYLLLISPFGRNIPANGRTELLYDNPIEQVQLVRFVPSPMNSP